MFTRAKYIIDVEGKEEITKVIKENIQIIKNYQFYFSQYIGIARLRLWNYIKIYVQPNYIKIVTYAMTHTRNVPIYMERIRYYGTYSERNRINSTPPLLLQNQ